MRYFIWFSYDGTQYHGWQIQPNGVTVQSELQRCLSLLLREEVTVTGAGRTDTGVHARRMAAHFDTETTFDPQLLTHKLNGLLHQDIGVYGIEPVSADMHYELMNQAGRILLEYEDFGAFCKAGSDVKTTLCHVIHAQWHQTSATTWYFEITANRFLRNMVRAVVGTLIEVGRGRMTLNDFRQVIEGKQRTQAGESMPAKALFLEDVKYG